MMKQILLLICALLLIGCNATTPQKNARSYVPLEQAETEMIQRVQAAGKKMYEKDIRAARASDLVLSRIYPEDFPNFAGWITYKNDKDYTVSFYHKPSDNEYAIVADVIYESYELGPEVVIQPQRSPTDTELSMLTARQAAIIHGANNCSDRFNTVVLEGVNPQHWEVYVLAATTEPDVVPVGGNSRVTISKATGEIIKNENLSKSCLALNKSPDDLPEGASLAMLTMSHIVTDYPVEIHPYLNLLHGIDFAVITQRGLWFIVEGEISLVDTSDQ